MKEGRRGEKGKVTICTLLKSNIKNALYKLKQKSNSLQLNISHHQPLQYCKRLVFNVPKYLIITWMIAILSINTTGKTQAFEITKDTAIGGNTEQLSKTISSINPYTTLIEEKTIKSDVIDENYLSKPEVIKTKTREELDKEKEAEKRKDLAQNSRNVISRERTTSQISAGVSANIQPRIGGNSYFYGFCTWYAADRRAGVPNNWGNAGRWLASARSAGWPTGNEPKAGAILVTNESWVGHVGYVESVDGDIFTVSEMNLRGWARVSTRTLSKTDSVIKGFIY